MPSHCARAIQCMHHGQEAWACPTRVDRSGTAAAGLEPAAPVEVGHREGGEHLAVRTKAGLRSH